MECHKMLELMSPYLDGELEPSLVKQVDEHLKYCHKCQEELKTLQELTSVLQTLPEVTPPPEFQAGLKKRLAKLPIAEAAEISKPKTSPMHRFIHGSWSKVFASAAVIMLAFGITALWYPESLGLNIKPVEERNAAFLQTEKAPKTELSEKDSAQINIASDSVEPGSETENKVQDPENKNSENQDLEKQDSENPQEVVRSGGVGAAGLEPAGELEKKVDAEQNENSEPKENIEQSENAGQEEVMLFSAPVNPEAIKQEDEQVFRSDQFTDQKLQKTVSIDLEVTDMNNSIEGILTLGKDNFADITVSENEALIIVPVQNYEPLVNQLTNYGQIVNKEPELKDISPEYQRLSEELQELQEREKQLLEKQLSENDEVNEDNEVNEDREQLRKYREEIEQKQKKLSKLTESLEYYTINLKLQ